MKRLDAFVVVVLALTATIASVHSVAGDVDYPTIVNNFDTERTWTTMGRLASDQFAGRKAGTRGADLSSEYIADYFNSIGLKPAGSDGSYRTRFALPLWELAQLPTLTLVDSTGKALQSFDYRKDFYVQQGSGSGDRVAGVVFVGYGISVRSLDYDDYAGTSVEGRIVLAIIGIPPVSEMKADDYGAWYSKAETAQRHGAVGLILVDSPSNPTPYYIERWNGGWTTYTNLAILRGSIAMADKLLKDTGMTLAAIQQSINENLKPKSFALVKQLKVSVVVNFTGNTVGFNVLGFIPGADSAATSKAVIIGAHYDHLGKDVDGSIFHGANDNGSGAAVIMEIARLFSLGVRPRWSVLFAAWSGEEEGFYGSSAYVTNPYFPLAGTLGYLNLDMVGAGQSLAGEASTEHDSLHGVMVESAQQLNVSLNVDDFSGGSDHASFEKRHVPNLMFIYLPLDEVYHTPADVPDHVSKSKLSETGRLTALIALKLSQAVIPSLTTLANRSVTTQIQPFSTPLQVETITLVGLIFIATVAAGLHLRKHKQ